MNHYRFRLHFDGLCAFADRDKAIEAYALFGHGDHGATLTIRADFVNQSRTTWKPTSIGVVQEPDGSGGWTPRQVGIWSLRGDEVTFTDTAEEGRPSWRYKDRLIEFSVEHPQSSTWSKDQVRKLESRVGIVSMIGAGSLLVPSAPTADDYFVLYKDGVEHKKRCFSRRVTWAPTEEYVPTIQNRAGDVIALRTPDSASIDAWACLSNVAPVLAPEGLMHFHHYYIGAQINDHHMTIEQGFINVWDCVPPVAWP